MKNHLDDIRKYNVRKAWPRQGKCALLVVDMQNYFLPVASPIVDRVLSIVNACRLRNVRILFTRHGHRDIEKDGGLLLQWWGDCILHGTRDWEIMDVLTPSQTDSVIDKNRYSAFFGTGLDEMLRAEGIEELIITGVMTNCCCETTARDAFMRDYRVFFVSDATAAADEELHLATLKNMAFAFAHVLDTESLCRYLEGDF
ncbi:isochorismatase family protein [Syntrophus buswellii]|jgi:isochorismate hydrolase|uniref:isochorismatase family protein n=1 Tax=Syntrophus TaxID=43773 RepID=UPI0009CEE1B7|nr:MAG: Isochorismatase [Syntrophus sp. PtaB.Bin138]